MDWTVLFFKNTVGIETMGYLLAWGILTIYTLSILLIFVYSWGQAHLLWHYRKASRTESQKYSFPSLEKLPPVTVQLPVFNERYVVERLLEAVSQLEYPRALLQIQVLDDSTDASLEITARKVKSLQQAGVPIEHLYRSHRKGFKAGALKEGLARATGDLIAIFDADFVPQKEWLMQTVPHFANPCVGTVQTRWGHLNRNVSVFTKMQAFALDLHFTLEQTGRSEIGAFINFNGTAGIWRKTCITDAGNWEGDTLTEDLDLSFRSQLKGWKIAYLQALQTPAELPVTMSAIRSQQFRWQKGGAENFRKLAGRVLRSKRISIRTKLHGLIHLHSSSMFLHTFVLSVLSVPLLFAKAQWPSFEPYFKVSSVFLLSVIILMGCYGFIFFEKKSKNLKTMCSFLTTFVSFYATALGFSAHNAWAVLQGLWGKKTAFVRTPKFNVVQSKDLGKENVYVKHSISVFPFVELLLSAYFVFGIYSAFHLDDYGLLIFHFLLFIGFGVVGVYSLLKK